MAESEQTALLMALQSVVESRAAIAQKLGIAFGGERDYYKTLGYQLHPDIRDYYARYYRQDIAKKIVNAYPDETWKRPPEIWENKNKANTQFEVAWQKLAMRMRFQHYWKRVDRTAGLGRFGVLLLGISDGRKLDEPVALTGLNPNKLTYLAVFSELYAEVESFDSDPNSPRYGLPQTYMLDMTRGNDVVSGQSNTTASRNGVSATLVGDSLPRKEQLVHHDRIIHVAEELLEDDVYGTPRLEAVYNLLDDLQKLVGGSAEMFWRNASRDLVVNLLEDAVLDPKDREIVGQHVDEFVHGLRRVLRLEGMEAKTLPVTVASPHDHVEIVKDFISATTGIPKRILFGSERGELASNQDERNWAGQVMTRNIEMAEPMIVRPTIDRLIKFRILPTPANGYIVEWPSTFEETENEKADTANKKATALATVANGSVLAYFPLEEVREHVLGMDPVSPYEMDELLQARDDADDDDVDMPDDEEEPDSSEDKEDAA